MTNYPLFPPQNEDVVGFARTWWHLRQAGAGNGVLIDANDPNGMKVTRASASSVNVAAGHYANKGIWKAYAGASPAIESIPAASEGYHRYDSICVKLSDNTIVRVAGTEAVPDDADDFLENFTPLPADLNSTDYIELAIICVDEDGIRSTDNGTYSVGGVCDTRPPFAFGLDDSTLKISANGKLEVQDLYPLRSTLTTRGDLYQMGAAAIERLAKPAEGSVLVAGADQWTTNTLAALITALDNDVTQAADKYIATDEIRARPGTLGLKFDGVDDWIDSGTIALGGDYLTVHVRMELGAWPVGAAWPAIFEYGGYSAAGQFICQLNPDRKFELVWVKADNNLAAAVSAVDLIDPGDGVHDVIVTYDADTNLLEMYLDNVQIISETPSPAVVALKASDTVRFGKRGDGCYIDVTYSKIGVWQRIITAGERADLCDGEDISATNLVISYDFSEGSGGTLTDLSVEGNDGTLTGFADTTAGAGDAGASGWMSAEISVGPNVHVAGRIWAGGDIIGEAIIDRCQFPPPNFDALAAIKKIKGDGKGGLDHSTVPDFASRTIARPIYETKEVLDEKGKPKIDPLTGSKITERVKIGDEVVENRRNIGAMISIHDVALQQLLGLVESLQAEVASLKKQVGEKKAA